MAGHSKFKNIMHRKNAQDSKRAKVFTKIAKLVTIAARSGTDPKINPSLRSALSAAKDVNMPNENIQRAINKVSEKNSDIEVKYTGYGPENIAFLIEVITDNSNRSVTELRTMFNKHGNGLTDLSFMFSHVTFAVIYESNVDDVLEKTIDFDIIDVYEKNNSVHLLADFSKMNEIHEVLEKNYSNFSCKHIYHPSNLKSVKNAQLVQDFIDKLDDHDDIQNVWHNCDCL